MTITHLKWEGGAQLHEKLSVCIYLRVIHVNKIQKQVRTPLLLCRLAFPESNLLFEFVHILLNFLLHPFALFNFATHSLKNNTNKFLSHGKQTDLLQLWSKMKELAVMHLHFILKRTVDLEYCSNILHHTIFVKEFSPGRRKQIYSIYYIIQNRINDIARAQRNWCAMKWVCTMSKLIKHISLTVTNKYEEQEAQSYQCRWHKLFQHRNSGSEV